MSYPGCEREADATPVIAWAGWNHLEQAKALGVHYVQMRDREGRGGERLVPLLAGIVELSPVAPAVAQRDRSRIRFADGDFYADFVREEARRLGSTEDAIRAWQPSGATAESGNR